MFHYVYRITNKKENKHYYGVRSSKVEPKLDLGVKYFSSSTDKEFINEQKINNYLFKYKIIKQFSNRSDAGDFESKLHLKFNVLSHNSFYNKSNQIKSGNYFSLQTHSNFGKRIYNNGIYEKFLNETDLKLECNKQFTLGRLEQTLNKINVITGKILFNDGVIEKYFFKNENIPDNWRKGRLDKHKKHLFGNRSDNIKENIKNSHADFSKENHPRAKRYILTSPDNIEFYICGNLKEFCKNNNLNYGLLIEFKDSKVKKKTKNNKTIGWSLFEMKRIKL